MSERRLRVYVAGPYTLGDPVVNTATAMRVGLDLIRLGYAPFVPHGSMFFQFLEPLTWDEWLDYDLQWVRAYDSLAITELSESRLNGKTVYGQQVSTGGSK